MIEEQPQRISREEARAHGMVRYVDSEPCRNGHPNPVRWVLNNQCVRCRYESDARDRSVKLAPGTWSVLQRRGW